MDMNDDEMEEEATLNQILTPNQSYLHERRGKWGLDLVEGSY